MRLSINAMWPGHLICRTDELETKFNVVGRFHSEEEARESLRHPGHLPPLAAGEKFVLVTVPEHA